MDEALQLQRRLRLALQADDHEIAIDCLQQAAALAHQQEDRATEGRHLGNLALVYNRLGRPADALRCFEQALVLVRAEGDRVTEDGLLGNMGNILRELKRYDDARDYLNTALQLAQEIGDVRGRGIWLSNLGLVYDDLGQPETAIEYHSQSIGVARQLRDQRGLANRLRKLSDSFLATGNPMEALKCLGEALTIYTDIGDQGELLDGLIASGHIHYELGLTTPNTGVRQLFFSNARDYYRHALSLTAEADNPSLEAFLFAVLGKVLSNLNAPDEALESFTLARSRYAQLGQTDQITAIEAEVAALTRQSAESS